MCGLSRCDLPMCTWGEQYRHQKEVEWVLTLSKSRRDQYWKDIEQWRGKKARDRLFNAARDEYNKRRNMK